MPLLARKELLYGQFHCRIATQQGRGPVQLLMESLQEFVSGKVYYQRNLLVSYGGLELAPGADVTKQLDYPRVPCRDLISALIAYAYATTAR